MPPSNPLSTSSKYAITRLQLSVVQSISCGKAIALREVQFPSTPDALGALWRKRRLLESQKNEVLGATKQDEKNSNANVNEEGGVVFLILLSGIAPCLGSTAGVRIT